VGFFGWVRTPRSEGLACTISAPSSLLQKFRFLAQRPLPTETLFESTVRLLRRKAEHLMLSGPLRWQVGEASNAHAMRQPTFDRGLYEIDPAAAFRSFA
jgi:hypothetical protein